MSVNRVIIVGHLGADPEARTLDNGTKLTRLSVATNYNYQNRDNKQDEKTEWHRVTVFGKSAENCEKYLSKGSQVFVEGRLQTNEWEDKNGVKRYFTDIVASSVQFLGKKQYQAT